MTDGTHLGAQFDRDFDKMGRIGGLLVQHERLLADANASQAASDKALAAARRLHKRSRELLAEATVTRTEAHKLIEEVTAALDARESEES